MWQRRAVSLAGVGDLRGMKAIALFSSTESSSALSSWSQDLGSEVLEPSGRFCHSAIHLSMDAWSLEPSASTPKKACWPMRHAALRSFLTKRCLWFVQTPAACDKQNAAC